MSIHAITKQGYDTSGAVPAATAKQVVSAEAAFSNALQSAMNFTTLGGLPSASSALGAMFLHQQAQQPMPVQKAAQPQQQQQNQAAPVSKAKDDDANAGDDQQQQVTTANSNAPRQTQSARSEGRGRSRESSEDRGGQDDRPVTTESQAAQQNEQQVVAAAVQVVEQQVVAKVADAIGETSDESGPEQAQTEIDPLAIANVATDAAAKTVDDGAEQTAAGPATDGFKRMVDDAAAKTDAGPVQQAKQETVTEQTGPVVEASDDAAKTRSRGEMHDIGQNQSDLVRQQSDDLASRLDSGANVAIKVKTDTARQADSAQFAGQAATQDVVQGSTLFVAQTSGQSEQKSGQQGWTPTDGAAQLETTTAQTVQAQPAGAQGAFAAVLAAQADAGPQTAAPQGQQTQTTQPVAGLNAADATQGTQKASPTQSAQAPTPARTQQQAEVAEQIAVEIQKHAGKEGVDTIKVQLKPHDLGRIEIRLEVSHDGSVSATVTADNKSTLAMLQGDSESLSKALSDAGLKAQSGSLSFNLRGDQQQQQASENGGQGRGGRRRMLGGIDATSESAASAAMQRARLARSGVDISV